MDTFNQTSPSPAPQSAEFVYSGFWRRFFAMLIDGFITMIPALILGYVIPYAGSVLISLIYKPIFEASPLRATPGKAVMGMQVLSEEGQTLTLKQSYIRYFSSIVSGLILCIGYLMNLITEKKQTLHDMIAQTIVVDQTPPDLNYFHVWLNKVKEILNDGPMASASREPSAASTASHSSTMTIEQLYKLYQSGALTEEEYNKKKTEILNRV